MLLLLLLIRWVFFGCFPCLFGLGLLVGGLLVFVVLFLSLVLAVACVWWFVCDGVCCMFGVFVLLLLTVICLFIALVVCVYCCLLLSFWVCCVGSRCLIVLLYYCSFWYLVFVVLILFVWLGCWRFDVFCW